jgi:excisionase family DNA binding protein
MLVTISEAARQLGVSPNHIRSMIRRGRWPFYRLGPKAMRVDVEEIKSLGKLIAERLPRMESKNERA